MGHPAIAAAAIMSQSQPVIHDRTISNPETATTPQVFQVFIVSFLSSQLLMWCYFSIYGAYGGSSLTCVNDLHIHSLHKRKRTRRHRGVRAGCDVVGG
ncbi:hypothetical protein [Corynebacterium efficiens YS-314]|uniref:Uncharacterized protein n=1 Tax=Corynebacterium efficiens (strain DSM 44549 / YS-314 / AJ 12310 / JCM 11189 / NBRC 100395) TaxID=196164 RepID=Q8FUE4_COREF|nr:hypothetical protein [Corynebacterium efficiens YS-314]